MHALLAPMRGDGITETAPVLDRVPDVAGLLASDGDEDEGVSEAARQARGPKAREK